VPRSSSPIDRRAPSVHLVVGRGHLEDGGIAFNKTIQFHVVAERKWRRLVNFCGCVCLGRLLCKHQDCTKALPIVDVTTSAEINSITTLAGIYIKSSIESLLPSYPHPLSMMLQLIFYLCILPVERRSWTISKRFLVRVMAAHRLVVRFMGSQVQGKHSWRCNRQLYSVIFWISGATVRRFRKGAQSCRSQQPRAKCKAIIGTTLVRRIRRERPPQVASRVG
jgi:hypothetical protein